MLLGTVLFKDFCMRTFLLIPFFLFTIILISCKDNAERSKSGALIIKHKSIKRKFTPAFGDHKTIQNIDKHL